MTEAADWVTSKTTYVGSDGPRRLIREVWPQSETCTLADDLAFARPVALSRTSISALVVAVHAEHQVAQQFDVLTKELRVVEALTSASIGYYAAPAHLRNLLHAAAAIILMTDPASTPSQRLGYGLDHTLSHFSQRHRDAVALGDQSDENVIDDVINELLAYAEALGLPLTRRRIDTPASTDAARVNAAWSALGASAGREYSDLSSAVHGRRRGQLARIEQLGDMGDSDADLLAVTLLWALRPLYLAGRAITALAAYAGAAAVCRAAAAQVSMALHILAYVGQRELDIMDADLRVVE